MNWNDFAKKYNIDNPLEFFADLENVSRKAQQPDLHKADVMRRFLAELKSAVEQGENYDYAFNGEDEIRVDYFNSNEAIKSVVELLTKWGMLPNGA